MNNWRIRIAILAVILFVIIATVISNCSGGGGGVTPDIPGGNNPPPGGGGYTPSDGLIDTSDLGMSLSGVDGDTYTFTFSGQPPDIKVGDILSGPENGGFLRLVTNVRISGNQMIVTTSQATIDEAIESGDLIASLDFTARDSAYSRTPQAYSAMSVPLAGTVIYTDSTVNVQITEGNATFAPRVALNLRYDKSLGLTYFKGTATGDIDYDFQILTTGDADFDLSKEKLVYTSPLRSYKIGPIYGAVRFDFYAGIDLDGIVDQNISAGIITSANASAGAQYSDGVWSPVMSKSHSCSAKVVGGNADGSVVYRGYIRPEVIVLLAGVPVASVDCENDFELTGTGRLSPACLVYDLAGGLISNVNIATSICGSIPNFSAELLKVSENVDSGSVGECDGSCQNLIVNAISGLSEVDGGGVGEYSINATGDTGITYQWTCDPSYKGTFERATTSAALFYPIEVVSPLQVQIKVMVKSDHCLTGIEKVKSVTITNSGCPYNISEISGLSAILEEHTQVYSIMVQPYSIQSITFNWTCVPTDAGYFLSNNARIVEFFANSVSEDGDVTLKVDVDSDECDRITREKQVTVEDSGSSQG